MAISGRDKRGPNTGKGPDLFEIWNRLSAKSAGATSFEALPHPAKVFIYVWQLEADVNNGGFHQYYFNSAGDFGSRTPDALRTIGAPKFARIVETANSLFGPKGPKNDRRSRQRQLSTFTVNQKAKLNRLDTRFLKYPENLKALLEKYVRNNASAFSDDPE